jgi:DNA-binding MarR family transcriptional regulator
MNSSRTAPEIIALIERLSRLMHAREHETDLSPAQWEALRYLSRCNRFSNSPTLLARYLLATKGTVSQTLMALERKQLIEKRKREGESRSVELRLTAAGRQMLEQDPWGELARQVRCLPDGAQSSLLPPLRALLLGELRANRFETFGLCRTCRHFRTDQHPDDRVFPHHCSLLDVPLRDRDADCICAEHALAEAG